jgi:hypothetical protein
MNNIKKSALLFGCFGLIFGIGATAAMRSYAATSSPTTTLDSTTAAPAADTAATNQPKKGSHAALGNDGNVTAISGNTITMQEESDEGGASYTVDASKATITNNGAAATVADIKVGDRIFVQGNVSGTNVIATSVSLGGGRGRGHAALGNDGNVTAISGNTITMQEESDEGGASYTVDASKATITNNGAAATVADIKVGDKIMVSGAVSGNNVTATAISLGHAGEDNYRKGGSSSTQTQ